MTEPFRQKRKRREARLPTNLDENGYPICPHCGCNASTVLNTYEWQNGKRRRRRECDHCKLPFFTWQTEEQLDV